MFIKFGVSFILFIFDKQLKQNTMAHAQLIEKLAEQKDFFNEEYRLMLLTSGGEGLASPSFFKKVIIQHFEGLSTVMVNKCLNKYGYFDGECSKAASKAVYACKKDFRTSVRNERFAATPGLRYL